LKVSREVKTAILVIGSILVFIWGYSFLKGKDLFNSYKTLYVVYENVEDLSSSAPVTINGLAIGKVVSITPIEKGHMRVEMQINSEGIAISKTSKAVLHKPGFVGGKQIAIKPDFNNTVLAESGDHLEGNEEPGMVDEVSKKLAPLQSKVEATVVSADSLLNNLNGVFDKQTQVNLRNSIASLSSTMNEFNKATRSLNGMIARNEQNIDSTLTNMSATTANIAKITDSISSVNLAQTVKNLESTLANVDAILNDVQEGKGTMGKLLKDEEMYDNLNGASKELKELLADIKNNPKRYIHFSVFGKKSTQYVERE